MMDFITRWHPHYVVGIDKDSGMMGVGKDSGHGTWLSLISFHGMTCRIPQWKFHVFTWNVNVNVWNMTIACTIRWRVASVGNTLYWAWLTFYGKTFQVQGVHRWTSLI